MKEMNSSSVGNLAAVLSVLFALGYSVAQIATLFDLLPPPYDLIAMFVPSLLLAPCFVMVMAALFHRSDRHARLFTLISLCFALVYCVFVSLVYFGQLAAIIPLQAKKEAVDPQLLFRDSSLMVAIDCLGYGFMSLSALVAAFAFKERKGLFRSLLAHGLLAPFIIASFFVPALLAVGAFWMITFPWAMIQAAWYFNRVHYTEGGEGSHSSKGTSHRTARARSSSAV